ncbi:MAG: flavodoxin domain-containing protein [Candidatus Thorarchaeota archaeon]
MRVVVIYESTRGRTKVMAEAICEGAKSAGVDCDLINAPSFKSLDNACALAVGASTRMKRPLPKVRQILTELPPLDGKPVAAFGSYGWSGEAPEFIGNQLESLGGVLVDSPLRVKDYPDNAGIQACMGIGKRLAESCK